MPRQILTAASVPFQIEDTLRRLGRNIATARLRRRLSQRLLAHRAGIGYTTLQAVERGSPTTSIGAYFAALWAMGLEREFDNLASPDRDEEGKALEALRRPTRASSGKRALDADF